MNGAEKSRLRGQIEERLRELEEIVATGEAAGETVELDQTRVGRLSRMDALQQQAMARAMGDRRTAELRRLRHALETIDDAHFGFCEGCGEVIAPGRLLIDPGATHCVNCAE
ncbi:MAG: TraR/DksA C4-type zinc finger protein [Pseudomonadota bacterium]